VRSPRKIVISLALAGAAGALVLGAVFAGPASADPAPCPSGTSLAGLVCLPAPVATPSTTPAPAPPDPNAVTQP